MTVADADEATDRPPDPTAVYGAVRSLARFLDPGAGDCKIVYRNSSGTRTVIAVPEDGGDGIVPDLTPMQEAVKEVVDGMRPGTVKCFDEIAEASGYSNCDDLRVFVRTLAAHGRLKKGPRGWEKI